MPIISGKAVIDSVAMRLNQTNQETVSLTDVSLNSEDNRHTTTQWPRIAIQQ
jgi:hypothetical protein